MHVTAQPALVVAIVAGAFGALIIGALAGAFGFGADDPQPHVERRLRRFTRLGHGLAGLSFALAAVAAVVALAQSSAASTPPDGRLRALQPSIQDLTAVLHRIGEAAERLQTGWAAAAAARRGADTPVVTRRGPDRAADPGRPSAASLTPGPSPTGSLSPQVGHAPSAGATPAPSGAIPMPVVRRREPPVLPPRPGSGASSASSTASIERPDRVDPPRSEPSVAAHSETGPPPSPAPTTSSLPETAPVPQMTDSPVTSVPGPGLLQVGALKAGGADPEQPRPAPERRGRDNDGQKRERGEKDDRQDQGDRATRTRRPDKLERAERPERVERMERPERVERVERRERVERTERREKVEKPERGRR